ncbi:MAG TPA: hypothetical protein VM600_03440 [Actinomycetota bacterium]|nr:hypothetical protein [Actinomycetota bacterium]
MTRKLASNVFIILCLIGTVATPVEAATTCRHLTTQRLTSLPAPATPRVAFIYVLPTGATDDKLDLPQGCSDGTFRPSVLGYAHRDISVWMAKTLGSTTTGTRRLVSSTRSYRNTYTSATKSMTAAYFIRSPESQATWDCRSPDRKWDALRSLLASKGFTHPGYVYAIVLHAKQTCNSIGVAGAGGLGTAGTSAAVAYALRFLHTGDRYVRGKFGCANYVADAVLAHEILHVLGGVPFGAAASDSGGHITTDHDIMEKIIDGAFATNTGATRLRLDAGANDYRREVVAQPFDVAGLNPSTPYRRCS